MVFKRTNKIREIFQIAVSINLNQKMNPFSRIYMGHTGKIVSKFSSYSPYIIWYCIISSFPFIHSWYKNSSLELYSNFFSSCPEIMVLSLEVSKNIEKHFVDDKHTIRFQLFKIYVNSQNMVYDTSITSPYVKCVIIFYIINKNER